MILQLQKYDISVIHLSGKDIPVADTLSRRHLNTTDDMMSDIDLYVHTVIANLPVADEKMNQIRHATEHDLQMQTLKATILSGWPDSYRECKPEAQEFFNHRDELSVVEGIILKGERIIIPKAMRPEILQKIHASHLGIEKCKQRAREAVFWPGLSADVETTVNSCRVCRERSVSQQKEPMISHTPPNRPWQKVGIDQFTLDQRNYLITVDYYSRFFEIDELQTATSASIIRKLSVHFARHGIPEIVFSDNGTNFTSLEFQNFARTWDFKHDISSPEFPQSYGLAERSVQTAKNIITKAKADRTNPLISLLEYRAAPVDGLASPAQLLMGRRLRSILPATSQSLKPEIISPESVKYNRAYCQTRQKTYFDRCAHPLPPLKEGDNIYIQRGQRQWQPATVTRTDRYRSYQVQTPDGKMYRRNRVHLRKAPASPVRVSNDPVSDTPVRGNDEHVREPPAMDNVRAAP